MATVHGVFTRGAKRGASEILEFSLIHGDHLLGADNPGFEPFLPWLPHRMSVAKIRVEFPNGGNQVYFRDRFDQISTSEGHRAKPQAIFKAPVS